MDTYAKLVNGSLPIADSWTSYFNEAQTFLPASPPKLALLALINVPILAVVLNVIWQLLPSDPSKPPLLFHWFPFIGSSLAYGLDPLNFMLNAREKHGDVFTFVLLGRHVTVCLGSRGNNFVLGGKSMVFNAEDAYKHFTTPVFGTDVVYDVPNDMFMEQKKFAKVALSTERFRTYVGEIEEEVEEFLKTDPTFSAYQSKNPNEWGKFDAIDCMAEVIILTAARTLQGKEVRNKMDKSFAAMYHDLDGGFTPLNFMFPNLPLPSYRRRDVAQERMRRFYTDILNERKQSGEEWADDVITALSKSKYRNGEYMTEKQVAHLMIAMLMAGQHTSSATSGWALLEIAANPEIADALYQEQVKHFSAPDGSLRSITYDDLRNLPVLDSVIRETLRVHPPIHSILRKVRDDVPVPPTLSAPKSKNSEATYVVPKGNYVLASPSVSQMDPRVWKNANAFNPTRWSDPQGVAAQALKTYDDATGEKVDYGFGAVSKGTESPYQPFGAGRHRCIGEQFAYLQLGTVLSTIIRRLEIKLDGPVPSNDYTTMITMPQKPRMISYRRRA